MAGGPPIDPSRAGPVPGADVARQMAPALREALVGFGVPEVALPWIDRFFEPAELSLIAALAGGPLSLPAAVARMGVMVAPEFFERARRRGIVDRPTPEMVGLADFETRFDLWVVFEGWKDLPDEVRDELREWQLGLYVEGERPMVEALLAEARGGNHAYLLLEEAEAQVMRAEHVYLWPCDCRASMDRCSKPSLVCVRFENDRGIGFEISRERAVEVLRQADRAGLMRTGDPQLGAGGEPVAGGAICNCCADCCFPHLAAERLGSQKVWPLTRFVAARDPGACTLCARCTRRCPFGAFTARRGDGAALTDILFDEALCRGCGVCATGCPEGAITMEPLA